MRRCAAAACVIFVLSAAMLSQHANAQVTPPPAAAKKYEHQKKLGLEIHVLEGAWGDARAQDIEIVLYSVAATLLEHFPGRRLDPIVVAHSDTHPITLFKRGPGNEYQVRLSARGTHWAAYAYEFAHELSHILNNYEHHPYSNATSYNQWFAESLCEVASLYVLKRLTFVWEVSPPYPQWADYAPAFEKHVERILSERRRQLPPDTSLATWFQKNENELRHNPYLRSHNAIVASLLLPLFEEDPRIWEAIGYLNLEAPGQSFQEYLQAWRSNAPEDYRDIIDYMMAMFGTPKNGETTGTAPPDTAQSPPAARPDPKDAPRSGPAGPPLR